MAASSSQRHTADMHTHVQPSIRYPPCLGLVSVKPPLPVERSRCGQLSSCLASLCGESRHRASSCVMWREKRCVNIRAFVSHARRSHRFEWSRCATASVPACRLPSRILRCLPCVNNALKCAAWADGANSFAHTVTGILSSTFSNCNRKFHLAPVFRKQKGSYNRRCCVLRHMNLTSFVGQPPWSILQLI